MKYRVSIRQKNGIYTNQKKVLQSETCKFLWDFPVKTDKTLEHYRPDITVIDKKKNGY